MSESRAAARPSEHFHFLCPRGNTLVTQEKHAATGRVRACGAFSAALRLPRVDALTDGKCARGGPQQQVHHPISRRTKRRRISEPVDIPGLFSQHLVAEARSGTRRIRSPRIAPTERYEGA
jgi:hypothetical protein